MTNAEAAAHFASLPPNDDAEIIVINGDLGSAEVLDIDKPGTNLDEVDEDFLETFPNRKGLVTAYTKW